MSDICKTIVSCSKDSGFEKTKCQEKILDTMGCLCYDSQGERMEKILEQTLLYDFYGELLTEHQRQVYEDVVLNDFSLSEVAENRGISRQGVHDMIRRCNRSLEEYEHKLHLVEKFLAIRENVERIRRLTGNPQGMPEAELMAQIERICTDILEEL